jgi:hypothetical protein
MNAVSFSAKLVGVSDPFATSKTNHNRIDSILFIYTFKECCDDFSK